MNEVQAYQAVYGDLVRCVPHYAARLEYGLSPGMMAMNAIRAENARQKYYHEAEKRRRELEDYLTPSGEC